MQLSQVRAAQQLGISRNALRLYESTGEVPRPIRLAMAALEHRMPPVGDPDYRPPTEDSATAPLSSPPRSAET